jgi:hypothetical protein
MGFTRHQAEAAIKKYGTVQAALDSLLAGVGKFISKVLIEIYITTAWSVCACFST